MTKPKKKRNKKYTGADAATDRPSITRVQAVSRSKTGQWVHDRKKVLKLAGKAVLVVLAIIFIISGIVSLF